MIIEAPILAYLIETSNGRILYDVGCDYQKLADSAYLQDDFARPYHWSLRSGEYELVPGVRAIETWGHTAGHFSLLVERPTGSPILIAGDAADPEENLREEITPGLCWQQREDLALESIRKLKRLGAETGAAVWPNHDMAYYRRRKGEFPLRR